MVILDRTKTYTATDIAAIENKMLSGILACRTVEAVESAITYAHFLNKTGLTAENYPLFIKVLEIGNHWVIDALIGSRDPFLFFSSIQPNTQLLTAAFNLLAERHPGGLYAKSLSVVLGILQAAYNVPIDGYKIYSLERLGPQRAGQAPGRGSGAGRLPQPLHPRHTGEGGAARGA